MGQEPYFKEPFYVGFNVGGYELGLDPNAVSEGIAAPVTYWGVAEIATAVEELTARGARPHTDIKDVGGGIRLATFLDRNGLAFGVIENPHFRAATD